MLITRTFRPGGAGAKTHVLHETRTRACAGFLASLCGKQFPRKEEPRKGKPTCPTCLKLDNPFELSSSQVVKFWRLASDKGGDRNLEDLLKRDLVDPVTLRLTPRGEVLAADMAHHPPWPDVDDVVHARNGVARRRAVCGVDLLGVEQMSYSRLDTAVVTGQASRVTCLECMLDP